MEFVTRLQSNDTGNVQCCCVQCCFVTDEADLVVPVETAGIRKQSVPACAVRIAFLALLEQMLALGGERTLI